MRALIRTTYGTPDVVSVRDLPISVPGPGQVRLRVQAGGIDRGTLHLLIGLPPLLRLASGLRRPRNPVLGLDVAGVVDAVGAGVTEFACGDEVFGTADGALAEFALASPGRLARRPEAWMPTEAAAVPVSGLTALQALRDHARVKPGHRVLIVGASGGVGHFAVQLAGAMGCEVVGVCSPTKADVVRGLGASDVLDRRGVLPGDASFDALIDIGGRRPIAELRAAVKPTGRLALVGGEGGGGPSGGLSRTIGAVLTSKFGRQQASMVVSSENAADLAVLADYAERGQVRPHIDAVHPLADGRAALERLASGMVTGKVVVQIGEA